MSVSVSVSASLLKSSSGHRLGDDLHVRVADFGLSKSVYSGNYYRQKVAIRLPMKWMAMESLSESIFTTKTDVVSSSHTNRIGCNQSKCKAQNIWKFMCMYCSYIQYVY